MQNRNEESIKILESSDNFTNQLKENNVFGEDLVEHALKQFDTFDLTPLPIDLSIEGINELVNQVNVLGFESLGKMGRTKDGYGLFVRPVSTHQNGVYLLIKKDNQIQLITILSNTINKDNIRQARIKEINNYLFSKDWSDFEAYDLLNVFYYVIRSTVAKNMANVWYDKSTGIHKVYTDHYNSLFLQQLFNYAVHPEQCNEIDVNTAPSLLRHKLNEMIKAQKEQEDSNDKKR